MKDLKYKTQKSEKAPPFVYGWYNKNSSHVVSYILDETNTPMKTSEALKAYHKRMAEISYSFPDVAHIFTIDVNSDSGKETESSESKKIKDFHNKKVILRAPTRPLWFLIPFFSKKTMDKILLPCIADFEEEYFEAVQENRLWLARWKCIQHYTKTFVAVIINPFKSVLEFIFKLSGFGK